MGVTAKAVSVCWKMFQEMPGAADFGPVASQEADENLDRDPENSSGIRAQVHETGPSQSAARALTKSVLLIFNKHFPRQVQQEYCCFFSPSYVPANPPSTLRILASYQYFSHFHGLFTQEKEYEPRIHNE